jgi:DNA-binding NarL/FixJ family response regulator
MYKIIIVEDNKDTRDELLAHFAQSQVMECVFNTDSVERLLKYNIDLEAVQIILLDISLPFKSGIDGLPAIAKKFPKVDIIIYTVSDDSDTIFKAFCSGATGYLLKNQTPAELEQELVATIEEGGSPVSPQVARRVIQYFGKKRATSTSEATLTDTENQIMLFLKDALTYDEIAARTNLTIHGVRYHIVNIYKKLQVNSRQQAINKYKEFG